MAMSFSIDFFFNLEVYLLVDRSGDFTNERGEETEKGKASIMMERPHYRRMKYDIFNTRLQDALFFLFSSVSIALVCLLSYNFCILA